MHSITYYFIHHHLEFQCKFKQILICKLSSTSTSEALLNPAEGYTALVQLLTLLPPPPPCLVAWTSGVRDLVFTGRAAPDKPTKSGLT